MKNRIKWIWSVVMLISFPSVFAQESVSKGIGDMLYKMFGYIFVDIGKLGIGDRFYEFFMRFLLWIVIFACLFYAARFVFKEQKRIQIVVALVIALISIIMIPTAVLQWILQGYSIVTALLLLAFPMIGVIYLIHKVFGAPERHNYAIKAFLYYLLAMLIYNIHGVTAHYKFPGFDDWLGFAEGICLILAVWNAIRAMFPGGGDESTPGRYWPERSGSREQPSTGRGETPTGRAPGTGEPGRPGEPGTPRGAEEGTPSSGQPIVLGPPMPPNQPPPGPRDEGDNPTPPADPKMLDPKDPPRPEDPKHKPKPIPLPKDRRILIDNLWRWFLSIRNQDDLGACAAFAGTSMFEYIYNRVTGYLTPEAKVSELFLWFYARVSRNSNSGTYAHNLTRELTNRGVCKYRLWTFEDDRSNKYLKEPGEDAQADAPRQRIVKWAALSNDPDDWMAVLADGNPIYISADAPLNFHSGTKGYLGESGGYAATPRGHAMVICGYDSHYPDGARRNEAFRIRNSWGYGWADHGYVWIKRELLKEMVERQSGAYVFTGWQKHLPKKFPARVEGRVIFDNGDINPERTGAEYYSNDKIASPKPGYHVGAIVQVEGNLHTAAEKPVDGPDGRFTLDFPWDAERFEPLTQLSKRFPSLEHIDFKKQPAGIVIYRRYDKNLYSFHIVDFKDSMLGRGGEGIHYPDNPRSDTIHKGLKFSGRPIVFSNDHVVEKNVIIPIFMEKKEEEKGLKEMIVKPNYDIKRLGNITLIVKATSIVRNAIAIGPKLFKKLGLKGDIGKGVIQHAMEHQLNRAFKVMIKKAEEGIIYMNPELMKALNLKDGSEVTLEYGRDGKGMLYLIIGFYNALVQ